MGMRYAVSVIGVMIGCATGPLPAKQTPIALDPVAIAWAALGMEAESAPRVHWLDGCVTSVPEDSSGENRTGAKDDNGCIVYDIGANGWLSVRAADKPSDSPLITAMVGWRSWLLTTNFVNDPDRDGAARATAALIAAGL